jgi:hypothetical protein
MLFFLLRFQLSKPAGALLLLAAASLNMQAKLIHLYHQYI